MINELDDTWDEVFENESIWGSSEIVERRVSMEVLKVILEQPVRLRTSLGSLLNSLAPWKGRLLKWRLANWELFNGLVWIVSPRRKYGSDWTLIRSCPFDS